MIDWSFNGGCHEIKPTDIFHRICFQLKYLSAGSSQQPWNTKTTNDVFWQNMQQGRLLFRENFCQNKTANIAAQHEIIHCVSFNAKSHSEAENNGQEPT